MKARNIGYWVTTGFAALILTFGATNELLRTARVSETVAHLGYPAFLPSILGTWKVLAIVALLAPGFPRVKEWAYAGIVFDVTGAIISHLAAGDNVPQLVPPFLVLALAVASWSLRPASRVLGTLSIAGENPPVSARPLAPPAVAGGMASIR